MGFWKSFGNVAAGAATLTGKAAVVGTKLAAKGVASGARVVYDHREEIGAAAKATTRAASTTVAVVGYGAYKATAWSIKKVVDHRTEIGGATAGAIKGLGQAAADTGAHAYAREEKLKPLIERIADQSAEYKAQVQRLYGRLEKTGPTGLRRDALLDSLVVGGNTVGAYAGLSEAVPADVERAYRLAYPNLAAHHSFIDEVRSLDSSQLPGLVAGVKGKLFEIQYTGYLNDGHLPEGYHASLATSANQVGWDIQVVGPDGHLKDLIQAKATDSVAYVKDALERYPHIDVVTTDEVHSHLVMQGFADHVIGSNISDAALQEMVTGATDGLAIHFSWMPSAVSLALIAFSTYSQEGLDAYEKSKNFGERSVRSYLAYLAGGALAVATNTWWLGVLGGVGTRLIMGSGQAKRSQLNSLKQIVATNDQVLKRLGSPS